MADENRSLHVVVFPWLAFGHMLPYLELSKALARKGHKISFISTPRNLQRLPKLPSRLSDLVDLVPLSLPPTDGLREAAEATADVPPEEVPYLKKALDSLEQPFRQFVGRASPKPDWILQDFVQHWIPEIGAEAGVPTIHLSVCSTGFNAFNGPPAEFAPEPSRKTPEELTVPPPWIPFPSNLCYRLHEARSLFSDSFTSNASGISDFQRLKLVLDGCKAVAIRSSMELEPEWLELLPKLYDKPVIPIGLLPPPATTTTTEGSGGSGGNNILDWLSKQRSRSVAFVSLGSEAALSSEMLHQLALGLEISEVPFVWAFRKPAGPLNHEDLLPKGFEERCKSYGIVAKGWVPQLKILAHESVGGFLTHCGWGSVVESLHFGLPLVTLPISVDQGINARMITEKGISVEIERNEEDGSFTKEAVAKALTVVVGEEGEKYRKGAEELRDVFTDKDQQEKYVNEFARYLHES